MSYERRLDGLERRVSDLDGGGECRTCGYPVSDGSRGIQLVPRLLAARGESHSAPGQRPPLQVGT